MPFPKIAKVVKSPILAHNLILSSTWYLTMNSLSLSSKSTRACLEFLEVYLVGLLELGEPAAEDRVVVGDNRGAFSIFVSHVVWASSTTVTSYSRL
jgi:hypothetical protein